MQKLNVSWHGYSDHLREMMHGMMRNSDLTDVTLVCDDQKLLMAHKVVLSASSPVFQNIISNFSQNHSMIYLRGIQHEEMESILEFMYLGEATFQQERMEEFLRVGQSLEIKELTEMNEAVNQEEETNIQNYIKSNYNLPEESTKKNGGKQKKELMQAKSQSNNFNSADENLILGDKSNKEINIKQSQKKESIQVKSQSKNFHSADESLVGGEEVKKEVNINLYQSNKLCPKCSKTFKTPSKMRRHFSSVHEGLRPFNCKVCDKTFAQKEHMNVHMKNAHEPKELNF